MLENYDARQRPGEPNPPSTAEEAQEQLAIARVNDLKRDSERLRLELEAARHNFESAERERGQHCARLVALEQELITSNEARKRVAMTAHEEVVRLKLDLNESSRELVELTQEASALQAAGDAKLKKAAVRLMRGLPWVSELSRVLHNWRREALEGLLAEEEQKRRAEAAVTSKLAALWLLQACLVQMQSMQLARLVAWWSRAARLAAQGLELEGWALHEMKLQAKAPRAPS